ncbi:hypothetical protein ACQP1W_17660 [Spirillospora sp. CA-255316]
MGSAAFREKQLRQFVAKDRGHSGIGVSAASVDHHLGELADVAAERDQLWAVGAQRVEPALLVGIEAGWSLAQEPTGGLPYCRRPVRTLRLRAVVGRLVLV